MLPACIFFIRRRFEPRSLKRRDRAHTRMRIKLRKRQLFSMIERDRGDEKEEKKDTIGILQEATFQE